VAVALAKLIGHLEPPLVSETKKRGLLENLILNIVNTLKSRDSGARDAARDSLARIVSGLGVEMLQPVLYELDKSLREGYQCHVRNYTIRALLSDISETYLPPTDRPCLSLDAENYPEIIAPAFDKCIPLIISSAIDDLVGNTHEDRVTDGAIRTLIREAKGTKSNEILEICGRCILFRPSYALVTRENPAALSSVHALVSPLLTVLSSSADKAVIGRVSEALQRVALGIAKNVSVVDKEALLYIYSTLSPLLSAIFDEHGYDTNANVPSYLNDESDDEEAMALGTSKTSSSTKNKIFSLPSSWLPIASNIKTDRLSVREARDQAQAALHKVEDGFSAPKLTGSGRQKKGKDDVTKLKATSTNPANMAAIKFCLNLLYFCLKQHRFNGADVEISNMVAPFLNILMMCLKVQGAADVVVSTVRCLSILLSWEGTNITPTYSKALTEEILKLMFRGGALVSTDSDLVQACLKGATSLFKLALHDQKYLPLDTATTRNMLQMLTASVMEVGSAYQNTAFQLIKVIVDLKIVVPELYDIINKLCDQLALSHRRGVRETSSAIIISFILNYPVGGNKLGNILKKLLTNCSYEFEEGRLASIDMMCSVAKALPQPVLEDHCQLIFLQLTMRLVNETSGKCREEASGTVSIVVRRVGLDMANTFADFALRWLAQADSEELDAASRALVRTGAQITGLIASCRAEAFKHSDVINGIVQQLRVFLSRLLEGNGQDRYQGEEGGDTGSVEDWVLVYYIVHALEKLYISLPGPMDIYICEDHLLGLVQEAILYPHSWVRAAACRVIELHLSKRDLQQAAKGDKSALRKEGMVFQLGRRLCVALNQNLLSDSLLSPLLASLLVVLRALHHTKSAVAGEAVTDDEEEVDDEEVSDKECTGLDVTTAAGSYWVIRRLCGVAANPHGARRAAVLKFFSLVVTAESPEFVQAYLRNMLEIVVKTTASKAECTTDAQKETLNIALEVYLIMFILLFLMSMCNLIYVCLFRAASGVNRAEGWVRLLQ
jgi:hypothetical protein